MKSIQSLSESLPITQSFERPTRAGVTLKTGSDRVVCKVIPFGDYTMAPVPVPSRHRSIQSLVAKWEKIPAKKVELENARKWVAQKIYPDEQSLRALRLKKGLSQSQMADILETSQSHIARIEGGAYNLNIVTCRRLARALGIDLNTLNHLISGDAD